MKNKLSAVFTVLLLVGGLFLGTVRAYPDPHESVNIYPSQYYADSDLVWGTHKLFGAHNYSSSSRKLYADVYRCSYIDGYYVEDTSRLLTPGQAVSGVLTNMYSSNYYWYLALDPQGNYNGCRGNGAIWWAMMP